ncbi:hypothetical protein A2U01_0069258, partial [Trifolium medium]|nr:hypothetical protein [Trifolium medium]
MHGDDGGKRTREEVRKE